ncbi:MAG: hypothetical protein PVJ61_03770 [Dehalococcoidia bacterium]|jgi:archaellin
MIDKFMKAMHRLHKGQRGMTGLETAIILIAFVTVAAVFGYAVLSAGIFSAEQGKETVYAGLEQAKSSMELKGSVIAYGAPGDEGTINDCDDDSDWTASAGVAITQAIGYGGGHSLQLTLDGTTTSSEFGGGLAAYGTSSTADLSQKSYINLYAMTDTDMAAGDLKLRVSDQADCTAPLETLDLPALTAGTWTLITLTLDNPGVDLGILTVGIEGPDMTGAGYDAIVYLDSIVAGPPYNHAELIVFSVSNAIAGKPIDLTPSPDNVTVISYTDRNIFEPNITWTVSFVGQNDGDYLLEMGEQAQVAVSLGFLAVPPGPNAEIGLQVKPPHGSVISIERTIPANIDAVMDLY